MAAFPSRQARGTSNALAGATPYLRLFGLVLTGLLSRKGRPLSTSPTEVKGSASLSAGLRAENLLAENRGPEGLRYQTAPQALRLPGSHCLERLKRGRDDRPHP